ncbi:MAG: hypothetical protein KatS3mg115_1977 [Candidatus Poribacteria bacterium]|nr:MAG: hypothetical protein KatS3mg115_1977 [Candidatus Poribacteria bacterium]
MRPIRCIRENVDEQLLVELRSQWLAQREEIERLRDLYRLLGNETRLSILWLLAQPKGRELCPCDLADVLGLSVPAVSQQLQRLRAARLVRNRRQGKTVFYSLTETAQRLLSGGAALLPESPPPRDKEEGEE